MFTFATARRVGDSSPENEAALFAMLTPLQIARVGASLPCAVWGDVRHARVPCVHLLPRCQHFDASSRLEVDVSDSDACVVGYLSNVNACFFTLRVWACVCVVRMNACVLVYFVCAFVLLFIRVHVLVKNCRTGNLMFLKLLLTFKKVSARLCYLLSYLAKGWNLYLLCCHRFIWHLSNFYSNIDLVNLWVLEDYLGYFFAKVFFVNKLIY